uniref:Uncharacterized protein n=1 Tax=Setaria viridis TaxID=4556 RepID=A0A4U6UPQ3_SETVI|nr:hypothetical protein SEVIR_5G424900v2 [Setaria viridis]
MDPEVEAATGMAVMRKRKAADVEELKFDESNAVPVDSASIYSKLFAANTRAMFHLKKASIIAAAEAMEVVTKQESLIIELKDLIVNPDIFGSMAFSKAKELADLSDDLQPFLKHLPDVSVYLKKQAVLIHALKLHFSMFVLDL